MRHRAELPNIGPNLSKPPAARQPTNSLPVTERRADHLFVNNVRFLSMAAVVALHCVGVLPPLCGIDGSSRSIHAMLQPFKFGTIGFFLISGFLMGEGLSRSSSSAYLTRRLKTVFAPWLVWVAIYVGLLRAHRVMVGRLSVNSLHDYRMLCELLQIALFDTAYWFVPNLMLAIGVLLLCRRFLYDLRLGCALFGVSLFYGANVYTQWLPIQSHTEALLGFVFYLWLGAWAAKNFDAFQAWSARIPAVVLIAMAALTGLAAFCEGELLSGSGALNTLRITTQVYSVVVVLAIFRARKALWPRALNVRTSTFGIYLAHSVVLALFVNLARPMQIHGAAGKAWGTNQAYAVLILAGAFITIYAGSLAITHFLLGRPHLCWMVGGSRLRGSVKRNIAEEVETPGRSFAFWPPSLMSSPASHAALPTDSGGHGD